VVSKGEREYLVEPGSYKGGNSDSRGYREETKNGRELSFGKILSGIEKGEHGCRGTTGRVAGDTL